MQNLPAPNAKSRVLTQLFTLPVDFVFSEPFYPQCRIVTEEEIVKRASDRWRAGNISEAKLLVLTMVQALVHPERVTADQVDIERVKLPNNQEVA